MLLDVKTTCLPQALQIILADIKLKLYNEHIESDLLGLLAMNAITFAAFSARTFRSDARVRDERSDERDERS